MRINQRFQPIFSIDLGKTIAHAAYVRSKSNEEIALWPWQVFAMASKDDQLIDRTMAINERNTISIRLIFDRVGKVVINEVANNDDQLCLMWKLPLVKAFCAAAPMLDACIVLRGNQLLERCDVISTNDKNGHVESSLFISVP